MRRRVAVLALAAGSLLIPATAAAAILPVGETTVVQVETGQLGFSHYQVTRYLDGSVHTDVRTAGGAWTVKATNVTVTPELDGTFVLAWPCPSTVADAGSLSMTRTPDGGLAVVQAGTGWSYELTSPMGRHTVRPTGACGARVVGL